MPEFTGRLRTPRLAGAPAAPTKGEMYYSTADDILYYWNGLAWLSGGAEVHVNPSQPLPRTGQMIWVDTDEGSAPASPPQTMLVGAPIPWLVAVIPSGYLEFNGQTITQVAYPELYNLFGATLPDLRGRTLLGANATYPVASNGGAATVALSAVQTPLRTHTHGGTTATEKSSLAHAHGAGSIGNSWAVIAGGGGGGMGMPDVRFDVSTLQFRNVSGYLGGNTNVDGPSAHAHDFGTGNPSVAEAAGSAHENLPPYRSVYWITRAG